MKARLSIHHTPSSAHRLRSALKAAHERTDQLSKQISALEAQLSAVRLMSPTEPQRRMSALLAICSAMLITHEVDQILQLVVKDGVTLFPGASGALLFLADDTQTQLTLCAASTGTVPNLSIGTSQSAPGQAYQAPRPMLVVGPELEHLLEDLHPQQIEAMSRFVSPWPPTSALLAPLRFEQQRIGALVLYGGTHAHMLHPRDLTFVQALADLAAVAVAEPRARARATILQNDLDHSQLLHAEARARLDAAQAQLLQSAKLAAVGELAASVAHEINNPLYAARNSLYLVEQDLPPEAPQRQFLGIAQTELARIARIITRMRDFYRPARKELEPTNLNELLADTIELVHTHLRHGQVTVASDFEPDLPPLIAHADQLRQVFLNLMLNACDAMPHGGRLTITTHLLKGENQQDPMACIHIIDTGTGIAAEHRPHLFEPFYTTKPQGTGLGLAISAHIITQHGGTIIVDSTVGVGSTFIVTVPTRS
ncbi:MAG: ATP-binding protein [Roseiflexaceae bacterium]|nr:ATP-binding protein [Roseiflexaceae bacterium]